MKFILIVLFTFNFCLAHSFQKEVNSMNQVAKDIDKLKGAYKPYETLIVFDIDNTILAMNQHLGSDQWFNWRRSFVKNDPQLFRDLLLWQTILFYHSGTRLTEQMIPQFIFKLQEENFKVLSLTSRSPINRVATHRELKKHKIDFNFSKIGKDFDSKIFKSRNISYKKGIFMTSGLNKGEMLKNIINYSNNKNIRQIVFIDDHKKHTDRVYNTLKDNQFEVMTYRYSREDNAVNEFNQSRDLQERSMNDLNQLKKTLSEIFPNI